MIDRFHGFAATATLHNHQSAFRRGCVKTQIYAMLTHGLEGSDGRFH